MTYKTAWDYVMDRMTPAQRLSYQAEIMRPTGNKWVIVLMLESTDYGYGGEPFERREPNYVVDRIFNTQEEANQACSEYSGSYPFSYDTEVVEMRMPA